jgi:hypothetical protein
MSSRAYIPPVPPIFVKPPPEGERPMPTPTPPVKDPGFVELDQLARDVFVGLVGHDGAPDGLRVWDDLARDAYAAAAAFLAHRAARSGPP